MIVAEYEVGILSVVLWYVHLLGQRLPHAVWDGSDIACWRLDFIVKSPDG